MSGAIKDGGPAFPTAPTTRETVHIGADGMSLRDWFAGQALANKFTEDESCEENIARWAYRVADAMLAAREAS